MKAAEFIERGYTEVTSVDLVDLVLAAYDLSRPQGLGFLQPFEQPLTRDEAERFIDREPGWNYGVSMDYVNDRAVKLATWSAEDDRSRLFIEPRWYDHSAAQRAELLQRVGLAPAVTA